MPVSVLPNNSDNDAFSMTDEMLTVILPGLAPLLSVLWDHLASGGLWWMCIYSVPKNVCAFQWVGSESETICCKLRRAKENAESPRRREDAKHGKRHMVRGLQAGMCCWAASSPAVPCLASSPAQHPDLAAGHHPCFAQTIDLLSWKAAKEQSENTEK